ncbi:MAG: cyclic nucleotide-binding domain-containing protein [Luteitalea sp.]|nr:cyclic nucleotide-binding domain-containing protein [Luteitalea sp.]
MTAPRAGGAFLVPSGAHGGRLRAVHHDADPARRQRKSPRARASARLGARVRRLRIARRRTAVPQSLGRRFPANPDGAAVAARLRRHQRRGRTGHQPMARRSPAGSIPQYRPGRDRDRAVRGRGDAADAGTGARGDGRRRGGDRLRIAGHTRQPVRRTRDSDREAVPRRPMGADRRHRRAGAGGDLAGDEDPHQDGYFVVVPNSKVSDEIIINYSEPTPETLIEVDVGVSYDAAPNQVKIAITAALADHAGIPTDREPEVLLVDFGASAVVCRIRVWTTDFGGDEQIRDRILSAVYYAFRRQSIEIPYPIQVEMHKEPGDGAAARAELLKDAIERVSIFEALTNEDREELSAGATPSLYASGELVVRQGEAGRSMFVVASGEVVVTLDPGDRVVARLAPGDFFGEMSLLTGAPRTANVRASADSQLIELTVDAFRRFVLANPAAVEQVGMAVARRAAELEQLRAEGAAAPQAEPPQNFLARVRRFLNLRSDHLGM